MTQHVPSTAAPAAAAPAAPAAAVPAAVRAPDECCPPADRVTRSLLGYGVIAGPLYVGVSLAQALTRDGFDPGRHSWSLLANGAWGWIQSVNLVVTGLMVGAFAAGLRRALTPGTSARWAPGLLATYGTCLVAAGAFRADPAQGFPAGTPDGGIGVSWHGAAHLAAGGIGFACLAAAAFALGRRYATEGRRGFVIGSRATGVILLAGFAMIASGGGGRVAMLGFTAAVILTWTWTAAVGVDRYRGLAR